MGRAITDNEAYDEIELMLMRAARRGFEPDEFMDRCRAQANALLRDKTKAPLINSTGEFITKLCPHCQLAVMRAVATELGVPT
jgi:hypothetical protein